jgi:ABC-type uncharacterized transport system fused permease/ATPase subunit
VLGYISLIFVRMGVMSLQQHIGKQLVQSIYMRDVRVFIAQMQQTALLYILSAAFQHASQYCRTSLYFKWRHRLTSVLHDQVRKTPSWPRSWANFSPL